MPGPADVWVVVDVDVGKSLDAPVSQISTQPVAAGVEIPQPSIGIPGEVVGGGVEVAL